MNGRPTDLQVAEMYRMYQNLHVMPPQWILDRLRELATARFRNRDRRRR